MVAIVAGQGLGLLNTSLGLLGGAGQLGVAGQGRTGEGVYVNASNGNLVVQQQDEWLIGLGPDAGIVRTYNSQGAGVDDNADNWRLGVSRRVRLASGTLGAVGSTAVRVGEDGSETVYSWDAARGQYVSKNGGGSFDTLSNSAGVWTWVDGDTGTKETYEAVAGGDARLAKVEDRDGNKLVLTYASATSYLVTQLATWSASTASGETVTITYDTTAGRTSDILSITTRYIKDGVTQPDFKRVSYTYETYNTSQRRLKSVTVDLTPQNATDNATAGTTYTTTYTYTDTVNKRLASITQTDGSVLEFGYDASFRINLVKETVSGQVRQTTFDYSVAGTTKVTDPLGQVTELSYETAAGQNAGQLKQIKAPAVGGVSSTLTYAYDADGNVSQVTDARGQVTTYRYDANGNRVYERNALGNVVERLYSGTNLLLQESRYTVSDPDGLGTGVQPGGALTQRYVYDAKGHLRFAISASGSVTEYRYNAAGQRTSQLDYPAGALDASTLSTVLSDFTSGAGALGTLPAGFSIVNGQLQLTSINQATGAWPGVATAGQPLGSTWKIEFTTPATLTANLVDLGIDSGTYGTATYRRHWLLLTANGFEVDVYQGATPQPNRVLGTAKTNTTYVMEMVTTPDGGTTLYVYEKGRERASGYSDSRQMAGWGAAPLFVIQGYNGPGAAGGTLGAVNSIVLDNLSIEKALESTLSTWTADKLSTAQRTDYTYNTRGQVDSTRTYASVDASGNGLTDGTQSVTQYVYDQAGNLLQKIDGRGNELATLNTAWAQAQRTALGYPADAASLTAPQRAVLLGKYSTIFSYDGLNRVTSTLDPASNAYTLTLYADSALQTKVLQANGLLVTSTYDQAGRLVSVARADGATPLGTTTYTYDKLGQLTSVTQPTGEKSYYLYDAAGRKVGQIDGESALTEFVYDANGQLVRTLRYANRVSSSMLAGLVAGTAGLPVNLLGNSMTSWGFGGVNGTNGTAVNALLGEQVRSSNQVAGIAAGEQTQYSPLTAVTAGKIYEVSVYTGAVNATASLKVEYYNASGTLLSTSAVLATNASEKAGGLALSDYKRLQGYVTIPAGATQMRVVVVKSTSVNSALASNVTLTHAVVTPVLVTTGTAALADLRPAVSPTADRYQWNVYDAAGRLSKTITGTADALYGSIRGAVVEYRYDGAGRVSDTIAYGTLLTAAQTNTLLASGSALSSGGNGVIVAGGTSITLTTDALNDRRVRSFYDADGRKTGELDAANYYTEFQYDKAGRLVRTARYSVAMFGTLADDGVPPVILSTLPTPAPAAYVLRQSVSGYLGADQNTYYIYNARGQLKAEVDAEAYATVYEYDAAGNKTRDTRYANKSTTTATGAILLGVTSTGTTRYVIASSGDRSTSYEYDADNRLTRSVAQPTGLETRYEYDALGNLLKTTAAVGAPEERVANKRYDKLGRVTAELGGEGSKALALLGSGATAQQIEDVWGQYATRYEYDQSGHLVATVTPNGVDGAGLRTVFYYDQAGHLTHSINALGEVSSYIYNAFGDVTNQRRYAKRLASLSGVTGGLKSAMSAAVSSALSALADDSVDARVLSTYDRAGHLATRTDEESAPSAYLYNAFGELSVSLTPTANYGLTTEYLRDRRGSVTSLRQTDLDGIVLRTTSTQYDAFGRAYQSVDANGNMVERMYDKLGREIYISEPDAYDRATVLSYDSFGRVIRRYDELGNQTSYTYDDTQRTLTVLTPAGISMVTKFDRLGQTVEVGDGRGNLTKYVYNKDGQVTETGIYEAGSSTALTGTRVTTTYDKAGRAYLTTDARGSVTRTTYDAASRVLTQVRDDNNLKLTSEYRYDGLGNAVWSRDATGVWTKTEYDRKGQVRAVVVDPTQVPDATSGSGATATNTFALTANPSGASALNQRTEFVYNPDGSVQRVTRGAGSARPEVTQYTYDELGRRTGETLDPDGTPRTTIYTFDANGNAVARTDALGQVTRYVYNASNLVTYVIDATGAVVKNDYDAFGKVSRTIAYAQRIALTGLGTQVSSAQIAALVPATPGAADQVTYNVYDADGRLRLSMDALGYVTKRLYDASGNVARVIRYAAKTTQINTTAGYVQDDRLTFSDTSGVNDATEAYAAGDRVEQYVYDGANRLTWKVDALGYATRTQYLLNGNWVVETRFANPITYPSGQTRLTINTAPQVAAQAPTPAAPYILGPSTSDQQTWRIHDVLGRVSFIQDPAGYVTGYTYDAAGRVKTATRYTAESSTSGNEADPGNAKTIYDYDAAGQLVKVTDPEGVVTLNQYDKVGRLTDATLAWGTSDASTTHYVLDAAGRILEETRAYGKAEQATTRYVLDALGQRVGIVDPRGIELSETDSDWAKSIRKALGGAYLDGSNAKSYTLLTAEQKATLRGLYTSTQEFDAGGRVKTTTNALGGITRTEYDAFGNAVKVTDPRGNVGYFYFDNNNQATWQIDPEGYAVQTVYNGFGEVDSITRFDAKYSGTLATGKAPLAVATAGEASTAGATLYVIKNATKDATTRIDHDKLGRQTRITDAENNWESMAYDGLGNKFEYTNKLGGKYTYTFDKLGRVLTETAPVKVRQYNTDGSYKTNPADGSTLWSVVTQYTYDSRGNVTQKIEAQGLAEQRTTLYTYDLLDRLKTTTGEAMDTYTVAGGSQSAQVPVETRWYDKRGNLLEVKAADGGRTLTYWDALDRKTAEVGPTGLLTQWDYADDGKVVAQRVYGDAVTVAAGTRGGDRPAPVSATNVRETLYTYDRNHRLSGTTVNNVLVGSRNAGTGQYQASLQNVQTSIEYDAAGNAVKETDGRGGEVYSYYDKLGRKILQVDAERYVTQWEYDEAGNVTRQTRFAKALASTPATTSTTASLLALVPTPTDKRVSEFDYDRMNRRVEERTLSVAYAQIANTTTGALSELNGTVTTKYQYNALGSVTKRTDATNQVTDLTYDAQNRLTKTELPTFVDWENASVRGTTDVEYTGLSQEARVIQRGKNNAVETDDHITYYTYGKNGHQTSRTDAQGYVVSFKTDIAGHITRQYFSRADADGVVSTDANEYVYDLAGRQTQQVVKNTNAGGTTSTLSTQETRYNAYGDITAKGTNGGWQEYAEYDNVGRTVKANSGTGITKAYFYDANGNATLTVDSAGADLRSVAYGQVLQQSGINMTISVYDKRNQLIGTYLPTTTEQSRIVTAQQVLSQQQSVNYTAATATVGSAAGLGSGSAVTMPAVNGSVAISRATNISATLTNDYYYGLWLKPGDSGALQSVTHTFSVGIPDTSAWGNGNVEIRVSLPGSPEAGLHGVTSPLITIPNGQTSASFSFSEGVTNTGVPRAIPARNYTYTIYKKASDGAYKLIGSYTGTTPARQPGEVTGGQYNFATTAVSNSVITGSSSTVHFLQSSDTKKVVLMSRPAGTNTGWTVTEVPQTTAGRFELDWTSTSTWPRGGYEIRYVAMDAQNKVINAQQGSMTLADTGNISVTQLPMSIGGAGRAFLDASGRINFTGQDITGTKLVVSYKQAGTSGAPTVLELTPDATRGAGWFVFNTASLSGNYEYTFDLKNAAGVSLSKGASTFTVGNANSVVDLSGVSLQTSPTVSVSGQASTSNVSSVSMVRDPYFTGNYKDYNLYYGNGYVELNLPDTSLVGTGSVRVVLHMNALYAAGQNPNTPAGTLLLNALDQTYYVPNGQLSATLGFTESGPGAVLYYDATRQFSISLYKQVAGGGEIYLGSYGGGANYVQMGDGSPERTNFGVTTTIPVAKFTAASSSATRMVLLTRPVGSNTGWKQTELSSLGGGQFILPWNDWTRGNYEIREIALDSAGNVLNSSVGTMALQNNGLGSTINMTSELIGGTGRVFLSDANKLNFTEQGSTAQTLQVRWRATGTANVWSAPITLSPKVIGGSATPGWFEFDPAAYSLSGSYEYVITAKDGTSKVLNQVAGSFTTGNANISALQGYQLPPVVAHFTSEPVNASTIKLSYRVKNSTGAYTPVTLLKVGSGAFDWDTTGIFTGTGSADYEYKYEAYDDNSVLVALAHGQIRLGDGAQMLSHTPDAAPTVLSFATPAGNTTAAQATQMVLQYRISGTANALTTVTLTRTDLTKPFVWDASAIIAPSAAGSLDYTYTLKTAANATINAADGTVLSVSGVYKVGPAPAPETVLWTISEPVSQAGMSVHRSQRINAYGEVDQETDGRGYVTDYIYNTLGKLITKKEPQTTATLANGYIQTLRPTTTYYYDAAGRLLGTRDANNNLISQSLLPDFGDNQSRVSTEYHLADGGTKKSSYDIFGNVKVSIDEVNRRTDYQYDKNDRLTRIDRPVLADGRRSYDIYEYDSADQRIARRTTDGIMSGEARERTYYDAMGRIVKGITAQGRTTNIAYTYDAAILGIGGLAVGGWKKVVTDPNTGISQNHGATSAVVQALTDYTDIFGRVTKHLDLGGHSFVYSYNSAGWLTSQTGSTGQNITYTYYANGYQKSIEDITAGSRTEFAYDANGNRTYEAYSRLVPGTSIREPYQNSTIVYDELNRIKEIQDPAATIRYEYDANGNRRRVWSYYHDGADGSPKVQDYWYLYDGMNRFTVTMSDFVGQRATSETDTAVRISGTGNYSVRLGYDKAGQRVTAIYGYDNHREDYSYSANGLLQDTYINMSSTTAQGTLRSRRTNDLMGRVTTYQEYKTDGSVYSTRTTVYDKDGRQTSDQVDGTSTTYHMLADGTLDRTVAVTSGTTITTYYDYEWWDSAKQSSVAMDGYNPALKGNNALWQDGVSHYTYDANGHLTAAIDEKAGRSFRYVTNAQGLILQRDQMIGQTFDKQHNYYYVNGNAVGEVGNDGDTRVDYAQQLAAAKNVDRKAQYKSWVPISSADFDQNYQAITASYPAPVPSSYTGRQGETLYNVAQAVWGDSTLWYLIAEANGLSASTTLTAGQTLTIPNKVTNVHNSSSTTKVYNAGSAIGDTDPTLPDAPPPPKPKKKGCGGLGAIIMVVVAVVATVVTAGAALAAISALGGPAFATVGAALASGTMAGVAAGVGAAAVGAAVGSIASQLVGMATGDVQKFSWSAVGRSAVTAALTAGVGVAANATGLYAVDALGKATSFGGTVAQAVTTNVISQGVGVALGLQEKFSWTAVAAAGAGAAASAGAGMALNAMKVNFGDFGNKLVYGTVQGMAGSGAAALARHQKPQWAAIAADSFGNALGSAVKDEVVAAIQRAEAERSAYRSSNAVNGAGAKLPSPITLPAIDPNFVLGPSGDETVDKNIARLALQLNGNVSFGDSVQLAAGKGYAGLGMTTPENSVWPLPAKPTGFLSVLPGLTPLDGSNSVSQLVFPNGVSRAPQARVDYWSEWDGSTGYSKEQINIILGSSTHQMGSNLAQAGLAAVMMSPPALVIDTGFKGFEIGTDLSNGDYVDAAIHTGELGLNFVGVKGGVSVLEGLSGASRGTFANRVDSPSSLLIGERGTSTLARSSERNVPGSYLENFEASKTPAQMVLEQAGKPGVVAEIRMNHILDGDVKTLADGTTVGSGGHYLRSPNVRVTEWLNGADINGVSQGYVSIRNPADGSWAPKLAPTTFYPEDWTRRQVQMEIQGAFQNSAPISKSVWEGTSPSGVTIRGYYGKPNGTGATAWPVMGVNE